VEGSLTAVEAPSPFSILIFKPNFSVACWAKTGWKTASSQRSSTSGYITKRLFIILHCSWIAARLHIPSSYSSRQVELSCWDPEPGPIHEWRSVPHDHFLNRRSSRTTASLRKLFDIASSLEASLPEPGGTNHFPTNESAQTW